MLLVPSEVKESRLSTCKACKHYVAKTQTCGTLIKGKVVQHRKQKVRLCGCIMPIKTTLKSAYCPIDKWHKDVDEETMQRLRTLFDEMDGNRLSAMQNTELHELYSKVVGRKMPASSCPPCVRKTIDDLRMLLDD